MSAATSSELKINISDEEADELLRAACKNDEGAWS